MNVDSDGEDNLEISDSEDEKEISTKERKQESADHASDRISTLATTKVRGRTFPSGRFI